MGTKRNKTVLVECHRCQTHFRWLKQLTLKWRYDEVARTNKGGAQYDTYGYGCGRKNVALWCSRPQKMLVKSTIEIIVSAGKGVEIGIDIVVQNPNKSSFILVGTHTFFGNTFLTDACPQDKQKTRQKDG